MHFFSVCDDVCCFRSKISATVLSLATPQTQQNMPQCRATFLRPSSLPLSHSHTDAKQKIAKLNISRVFYLACCCCSCCTCPSRLIVHRESELASDAVRPSTPLPMPHTHTYTHGRHWQQSVAIKVKCSISAAPSSSFPLGVPPCQMPSTQPAVALCPVPLQNGVSTTALLIWCTLPLPRSPLPDPGVRLRRCHIQSNSTACALTMCIRPALELAVPPCAVLQHGH